MIEELRKIRLNEIEEKMKKVKQEFLLDDQYNWFDKKLFKRKEYKLYLSSKKREFETKLEELESIKKKYEDTVVIQGLGYDLQTAISVLRQHSLPEVITEKEMHEFAYCITKPKVNETAGLILVHKTNYAPNKGIIKSSKEAGAYHNTEKQILEHTIPMKIKSGRDTVHFAVNGEVKEHGEGNGWDSCKYAVLIPFDDIPREQYAGVNENDTYTKGSVTLSDNSWVLVPRGEAPIVRQNNPNVNVIEYEGANVTGYADKLVGMLGYTRERIDPGACGGWRDSDDKKLFSQIIKREGLLANIHYGSRTMYEERFYYFMQVIIQLIKYVETNPETLKNPQFVEELKKQIRSYLSIICAGYRGTILDLCKDTYRCFILEGYELPRDIIMKLGSLENEPLEGVCYELAVEIVKMVKKNNEVILEEKQR